MPNWTANNVLFVGKEKQLKTLKDMLKSDENDFDFNNIVPMPKNIFRGPLGQEEEEKYGKNNWFPSHDPYEDNPKQCRKCNTKIHLSLQHEF